MNSVEFGKYRLIAELGHGGMADVFLALQEGPVGSGFRKLTVIKRLRDNLADQPEFIAMLVDEARITARLNHPNVVQTNEVGCFNDTYFISMEFLEGQPLHIVQKRSLQRAAKHGAPPMLAPDHQYFILMEAVAGLGHAHDLADYDATPLEIVHRDVTPQNIFVTYEGQVKVVDFGIAKAVGRASETRQGIVKGKVRYMAPEQAIGLSVTRQADLFAVGVMLWEAAVGRRMWKDMDDLEILQALVAGSLPAMPRELNPAVPEEIDRICRKALAVQVLDRYATAAELHADLEQYLTGTGRLVQLRREVASLVSSLFKETRDQVRGIIEKQLGPTRNDAAHVDPAKGETTALLSLNLGPDSGAVNSHRPSERMQTAAVAAGSSQGPEGIAVISDPLGEPARRRRFVPFALGFFVLLAATGVMLGLAAFNPRIHSPPVTTTASSQVIALRITSTTPQAFVRIDEGAAQALPIDTRVPRDTGSHHLVVEAPGYSPRVENVSFGQDDVEMAFDLSPMTPVTDSGDAASAAVASALVVSSGPKPSPPPGPAFVWRPRPTSTSTASNNRTDSSSSSKKADPKNPKGLSLDSSDPWKHN